MLHLVSSSSFIHLATLPYPLKGTLPINFKYNFMDEEIKKADVDEEEVLTDDEEETEDADEDEEESTDDADIV